MADVSLPRSIQAIFLDRDGVINRERPDYVKAWHEFEFLPGVLTALPRLAQLGVPILVISNQSAIGRGLASVAVVDEIHQRARAIIEEAGGRIDAFFVCPHHPADGCACRKPKAGLLWQASAAYRLDLTQCVFIGDAITDYQAATSTGCQSILVQTGRQGGELIRRLGSEPALPIVADLAAAAVLILAVHSKHHDE